MPAFRHGRDFCGGAEIAEEIFHFRDVCSRQKCLAQLLKKILHHAHLDHCNSTLIRLRKKNFPLFAIKPDKYYC